MVQAKKRKKPVKSRHLVLSSNVSIYPLFSRGCLFPPMFELSDEYNFPKPHDSKFVVFKDKIPANLIEDYSISARNLTPIAIELQNFSETKKKSNEDMALTLDSIPLSQVKKIIFRSEDQRKFFKASEFSDVNVSSINMDMTVEEEVFKDDSKIANLFETAPDEKIDSAKIRQIVRYSDSYAGFLVTLLYFLPADEKWLETVVDWLNDKPVKNLEIEFNRFQSIFQVILLENDWKAQDSESIILNTAANIIFQLDLKVGWPAKELLASLTDGLNEKFRNPDMKKELDDVKLWSELTRDILDDKKPLNQLTDEKSIALRSILILLVRESCNRLLSLKENDATSVGDNVWRCALLMTSIREGLRALPTQLKSATTTTETKAKLEFLGDEIVRFSRQLIEDNATARKIDLKYENIVENGAQVLALTYKGNRILTRSVESNKIIPKIKEILITYGFAVDSVDQNKIKVSSGKSKSLKSPVCVSFIPISNDGNNLIRFEIDVVTFNTRAKVKQSDPYAAFDKKFSKKELFELLGSNSRNCFGSVALKTDPPAVSVNFDLIAEDAEKTDIINIITKLTERAAEISESLKKSKK